MAPKPIDPDVTFQTRALHTKLRALSENDGFAFGNQGEYFTGVGWSAAASGSGASTGSGSETHPSDVRGVIGVNNAVSGYNAAWLFQDGNPEVADLAAFEELGNEIQAAHRRGSIITFHWPMANPLNGKSDKNTHGCPNLIDRILEHPVHPDAGARGDKYDVWANRMGIFADFLDKKARDDNGKRIPILFRPWHEMNLGEDGEGKWYQTANNSVEEYKALWQQTVRFMMSRDVHNVLYVYAPSLNGASGSHGAYLANYPGDDFVDVMSGDSYFMGSSDTERFGKLVSGIQIIVEEASLHGKIPALAETGYKGGLPSATTAFWSAQWLTPLQGSAAKEQLKKLAYVMTWSNTSESYYVPYPGMPRTSTGDATPDATSDFHRFAQSPYTIFANEMSGF